jgi:hypothetical protein
MFNGEKDRNKENTDNESYGFMLFYEIRDRRACLVVRCNKSSARQVGEKVFVSEVTKCLDFWVQIAAVSGSGDKTAPSATASA